MIRSYAIDPEFLKQKLKELSGAAPASIAGAPAIIAERGSAQGKKLARQLLSQEYAAAGLEVSEHVYRTGVNVIAEKRGIEGAETLIISSHYDSVGNAGANDDGIGTVAALAVAKALAAHEFKHTLRVVAFDQEETGLVGSREYARSLASGSHVIGDIQIEMMGTNRRADGAFHVIDCDRPDSVGLSRSVMESVTGLGLPLHRVATCTRASDHASFWGAGIPAIVLSENFFGGDGDPCYHRRCDVVDERLDFVYASNIAKAVASAAASLLEPAPSE